MEKGYINIALRPSTHKSVLLFRLRTKAKNMDAAVKLLLKIMREYRRLTFRGIGEIK